MAISLAVIETMHWMIETIEDADNCMSESQNDDWLDTSSILKILEPQDAAAASTGTETSELLSVSLNGVAGCPFCGHHFNGVDLRVHLALEHSEHVVWSKGRTLDDDTYAVIDGTVTLTVIIYKCYPCDIVFDQMHDLQKHLAEVHPVDHLLPKELIRTPRSLEFDELEKSRSPMQCSLCAKSEETTFASRIEMRRHVLSFHSKPLRCCHCSLSFHYEVGLRWHLKMAHGATRMDRVDKSGDFSTRLQEMLASEESTNECTECFKSHRDPKELKQHYALDHPGKRWCELCRQIFPKNSVLMKHLKDDHPTGTIATDGLSKQRFPCNKCSCEYATLRSLRSHTRAAHLGLFVECALCATVCAAKFNQETHELSHKGAFTCSTCLDTFENFRKLKEHLRESHIPAYECQFCDRSYTLKRDYEHHFRKQHPDEKLLVCHLCPPGKGFSKQDSYNLHMKKHAGVRDFSCDICGKTFLSRKAVRNHRVIHSDKKPFLCDICGMAFRTTATLTVHRRKIHADPDKPKWKIPMAPCEICGKVFNKYQIKVHQEYHTGRKHKCDICGKLFYTYSNLAQHLRCHSDDRPYVCPTCGVCFKFPNHLRSHLRSHTGEPDPYGRSKPKPPTVQSSQSVTAEPKAD